MPLRLLLLAVLGRMRGTRAGGVYDWDLDYLSPLMSLVHAAAVAVCFEKNTALSRGWCMPLTRGSAVCEQNASHNTQILACFSHQLD